MGKLTESLLLNIKLFLFRNNVRQILDDNCFIARILVLVAIHNALQRLSVLRPPRNMGW